MSQFINEYGKSIPELLCEEIINLFESENKYSGLTVGGVTKNILDSYDFNLNSENEKWKKYFDFLAKELSKKMDIYLKNKFYLHNHKNFFTRNFIIKKYIKNEGKYTVHVDELFFEQTKSHRIITFIWYLNSIEEGGETIFVDYGKIKPEAGKLLLFPSSWTYPHSSAIPISDHKYVIVGWIESSNHYSNVNS
jgi:hypothetical protein